MLVTQFLHKQTRRRIKLDRHNGGGAYETFACGRHIRCQNRAHNRLKRQSLCRACASTFMMRLQHARDMKRAAGASDRGPFRLHCPAKLLGGATAEQPLTRTTRADKISVLTGTGAIKIRANDCTANYAERSLLRQLRVGPSLSFRSPNATLSHVRLLFVKQFSH